jgi:hypothetical protein
MHSTLKLRESDPHDLFAIEPEPVPVAWADKVLADIQRDARIQLSENAPLPESAPPVQPPAAGSAAATGAAAPAVETTFRATATDDIHVPEIQAPEIHIPSDAAVARPSTGKWAKSLVMLIFAVCSAAAAAAWQHHGDVAKQLISSWAPAFALTSLPPTENTAVAAGQPDTPAVQAAAADPSPAQPATARPPESAAPAAAAPSPERAQLQSMARDLAAMGQQIEQLKASITELKANQQVAARDVAKPAEVRTSAPNPRPKLSAAPPRPAAAPARRPMPAYTPVQAAASAPLPPPPLPQAAPPPQSSQPVPPQQAADQFDEPVVRPPMPLR